MSDGFERGRRWPLSAKVVAVFAALSALASVVLGAAASHLPVFAQGVPASFATAQQLLQFHALAMLLCAVVQARGQRTRLWLLGALFFALGVLLFSVNIDVRLLLDWSVARSLVPWGGASFMLGWAVVAVAVVRS